MGRRGRHIRFAVIAAFAAAAPFVVGAVMASAATQESNGVTATFRDPDSGNWYTSPVTFSFTGLLPEDTCQGDETYNGPGLASATVQGTCTSLITGDYTGTFTFAYDAQAPVVTVPNNITEEATGPGGAVVTFNVSAEDDVSGDPLPVSCTRNSGTTFPLGSSPVTCTAQDEAGNEDSDSFNVVVQDTTGPEFGPTPNVPLEGNVTGGFQGAAYTLPTATDLVTGGVTDLECGPLPGALFPLGATTVNCTAIDENDNTTDANFDVTVADTTGPLFQTPPGAVTVQATHLNTGTPASNSCITRFLNVMVTDPVDASPTVSHDAPNLFPLGPTTVTFTATDSSGNISTATGVVTIAQGDQGPCTVDRRPPRNVRKITVRAGNEVVKLCWKKPSNADFWRVQIYRRRASQSGLGVKVYQGKRHCFRDRTVKNGVLYVYSLFSRDHAGNYSSGIAKFAKPHRILLLRPRDYGVVRARKPRLFKWAKRPGADYYNLKILRLPSQRVVQSTWPQKRRYTLPKRWRYAGRQKLRPGRYIWYVWPGYGPKSAGNYGKMMGPGHFRVRKAN